MLAVVFAKIRDLAPYAAMELLLPGGSLMALMFCGFIARRPSRIQHTPRESYR
jgi:hypothetical protein